jgi:adenylate kinase
MGKSIRKLVKLGKGWVLCLPIEWVRKLRSKKVVVVYDDVLLVMPRRCEKKAEAELHEVIKRLAMKEIEEAEAQGSSGLGPQPKTPEVRPEVHQEVLAHE